jgi:hypothetical protein
MRKVEIRLVAYETIALDVPNDFDPDNLPEDFEQQISKRLERHKEYLKTEWTLPTNNKEMFVVGEDGSITY